MDRFAAQALEDACICQSGNALDLSVPILSAHPPALFRRIIRLAVGRVKSDIRGITLAHIESVLALITSAAPRASLDLPGRIRVLKNGSRLTVRREAGPLRVTPPWESASPVFDYRIDRPMKAPQVLLISETGHRMVFSELSRREIDKLPFPEARTAVLDIDRLDFPLKVRNINPGDRFTPLGMNGTMKVSRFFNTLRLDRNERLTCPLVLSGADIVWVCGHRIGDAFKITPRTENVLKIELFLD
jgi:tRNA(Ile)-lysidine synthase